MSGDDISTTLAQPCKFNMSNPILQRAFDGGHQVIRVES